MRHIISISDYRIVPCFNDDIPSGYLPIAPDLFDAYCNGEVDKREVALRSMQGTPPTMKNVAPPRPSVPYEKIADAEAGLEVQKRQADATAVGGYSRAQLEKLPFKLVERVARENKVTIPEGVNSRDGILDAMFGK